jgi:DNA-binding PadR family transcriptional regulator
LWNGIDFVLVGYDPGSMAAPKGDLTASLAILGLLIQQPDTPLNLRARLDREFPHGRWSRSIVHGNIPNLARMGLICRVQTGEKKSKDVYEATPKGVSACKEWLRDAATAPPPLRDAMLLWLEHSDESERPELIEALKELEEDAQKEFEWAQIRLNSERALGRLGPADGSDWNGHMRDVALSELVNSWGERAMRLKRIRRKIRNDGRELHPEAEADEDG